MSISRTQSEIIDILRHNEGIWPHYGYELHVNEELQIAYIYCRSKMCADDYPVSIATARALIRKGLVVSQGVSVVNNNVRRYVVSEDA